MELKVYDLGIVDFKIAWDFQKEIFQDIKKGLFNFAVILCRHYPVITLGRLADKNNILVCESELKKKGIAIYEIERGGDITYHDQGQLTVYPVFNLGFLKKDIHWFLRQLEEVIMDFLNDFGVKGLRREGFTGVWVGDKKIASIGIAIKNWISFHGISINLQKKQLDNFSFIRPCGMDIEMTSLESLLGKDTEIVDIKNGLIRKFGVVYNLPLKV